MAIANLQAIITKVRKMTGTGTSLQLTDSQIIDYINSFYLYDFPAKYRALKLKDKITFNTQRGIDTYPFNSERYTTVEMPCYCMKREIKLFNDPWSFYGVNYNWQYQTNFATGDGTAGPYSGTTTSSPIIRSTSNNPMVATTLSPTGAFPTGYPPADISSGQPQQTNFGRVQNILITVNNAFGTTLNVTDDGAGNLIGDCIGGGSINYETGAIAGLIFTSNVTSGATIQIQYNPTQVSIPLSILFYQNQFTLRPVPDKGYTIELTAYRQPSQALLDTEYAIDGLATYTEGFGGVPEQLEWWECIAAGAAKKVYEDRLDSDGIALMDKILAERYDAAEVRTYAQLGSQRIQTIYSDQLTSNYGAMGWSFNSGG